mmetsp:Transcript_20247/g.46971  ORF Transcript_20247/g.46971 Transcript_20247/m.46971 type:complete len:815 (+) Transcript_20247:70-2514(+)
MATLARASRIAARRLPAILRPSPVSSVPVRFFSQPLGNIFRDPSSIPDGEFLDKYGIDLTKLAKQNLLDPVIGRDDEIRQTLQILSRRRKNNPMLIGEAGVGKTAILEGLAVRIVNGDVPSSMANKRIVSLDMTSLLAGAKYQGEFEERMQGVLRDVKNLPHVVLFIDELHTIMGAGATGQGASDAAQILKPSLARGDLHLVGATTLDEYRRHIEKDQALTRRFQTVYVPEPTVEDTVAILRGLKSKYEVHHGVAIQDDALIAAAQLSGRFLAERKQPDKSIDLIDEAASRLKLQQESKPDVIYELERRLLTKRIERAAMTPKGGAKELDTYSKARLEKVEEEIKVMEGDLSALEETLAVEKRALEDSKVHKEGLENAKAELLKAEKEGNYEKAGELRWSKIPALEELVEVDDSPENKAKLKDIKASSMLQDVVTSEMVAEVISAQTGIPLAKLSGESTTALLNLETDLVKSVVGQDHVLRTISDSVRLNRTGLGASNERPNGVFLFLGPTGVGKTELAKALSSLVFDPTVPMTRIDMSEYMEKHSVSRLVGAPPGYIGHEEGGQLTEAVRRRPYQIVLFDEFEKAHRDVWNVLLQVFDEGFLTDSQGRKVDFRNTVCIMTSNLGSEVISMMPEKYLGSEPEVEAAIMDVVRSELSPELLNRIDAVSIFNRLQRPAMRRIVDIQLERISERIMDGARLRLAVDDGARDVLADLGYDVKYGARPLLRVLNSDVMVPMSRLLLEGQLTAGDTVEVIVRESEPAEGGGLDDNDRGVLVRRMATEEHNGSAGVGRGDGRGDGGGSGDGHFNGGGDTGK